MDVAPHTLVNASGTFLLSRTTTNLLSHSYVVLSTDPPLIDVASFLRTAVSSGPSNSSATILQEVLGPLVSRFPPSSGGGRQRIASDAEISPGLWQALGEAQELRLATGGTDQFIGLRYIIFVILTARDGPLNEEVEAIFTATGADRGSAEEAIARYCMQAHETREKYDAWQMALVERGLGDAMSSWSGPTPKAVSSAAAPTLATDSAPLGAAIALLQPDDPWAMLTEDQSGAALEAKAFADMIVAKQFVPPLAVGIFGDWGSGKSYFMRLLYEAVADNRERFALSQQTGGITFCQRVVQIRFNAWYYVEENLWASLVDHIFTSLNQWAVATGSTATDADKLFDQLTTARRLTIEAAAKLIESRRLKQVAATKLAAAEETLRQKQAEVKTDPRTMIQSAFRTVVGKIGAEEKLKAAAETLGLPAVSENAEALQRATAALNSEIDRVAMFRSGVTRQLATPLVIFGVAVGTLVLPPLMSQLASWFKMPAAQFGASVAGLVAPLVAVLGWAATKTNNALKVVGEYRVSFDAEVARLTQEDIDAVAGRSRALADAEAEVLEAKKTLDVASQSANAAALAYNSETGGARVLRFVRDRVANGEYAKHLSFVATVRKDFEELSRLLAQVDAPTRDAEDAREAHRKRVEELLAAAGNLLDSEERKKLADTAKDKEDEPAVFERIVLYVDDLDRCKPEQVIAVLQAIHLLLTFPLFVVFVAVDVRWLRHALANRYPGLSDATGGDEATTSDYLEKVFQIPYWVRPFDADVTLALLGQRLGRYDAPNSPDRIEASANSDTRAGAGSDYATGADDANGRQSSSSAQSVAPAPRPLSITPQERNSIDAIATVLDGLPRRTLRFINSYWIIKGGLDPDAQIKLESEGHPALVALLTIAITLDDEYPALVAGLGSRSATINQIVSTLSFKRPDAGEYIKRCFVLVGDPDIEQIREYAALVSRYSFHRGLSS